MTDALYITGTVAFLALMRLRELAELELGRLPRTPTRVRSEDIVQSILPGIVAEGARRGVRVIADLPLHFPSCSSTGRACKNRRRCC
jgi:hypothetical protein